MHRARALRGRLRALSTRDGASSRDAGRGTSHGRRGRERDRRNLRRNVGRCGLGAGATGSARRAARLAPAPRSGQLDAASARRRRGLGRGDRGRCRRRRAASSPTAAMSYSVLCARSTTTRATVGWNCATRTRLHDVVVHRRRCSSRRRSSRLEIDDQARRALQAEGLVLQLRRRRRCALRRRRRSSTRSMRADGLRARQRDLFGHRDRLGQLR